MMYETQSPFDVAAKQPFLDQPAKKKWNLFSSSSSDDPCKRLSNNTAATVASHYDSDGYSSSEEGNEDYEAPSLLSRDYEEELVVFQDERGDSTDGTLAELAWKPVQSDFAILQERHAEFGLVRDSMLQINDIQKDLAALVDSQEEDIEAVASFSIETLGQTQAGLAHILRLQRAEQNRDQRKRMLAAVLAGFLVIAYLFLSGADVDTASVDGAPQAP